MKIEKTYRLIEFNSVFEIPIYRLTNSHFEKELNNKVSNSFNTSREDFIKQNGIAGEKFYDETCKQLKEMFGYKWKYNEIIGWINICLNDETVFGETFLKKTKKIRKNSQAKIDFYDCCFKIKFEKNKTNKEIFNTVLSAIEVLKKSKKYKNRYIDTTKFEVIGPFINWKLLYKSLNNH